MEVIVVQFSFFFIKKKKKEGKKERQWNLWEEKWKWNLHQVGVPALGHVAAWWPTNSRTKRGQNDQFFFLVEYMKGTKKKKKSGIHSREEGDIQMEPTGKKRVFATSSVGWRHNDKGDDGQ
jgi:hypothetical protein